MFIILTFLTDLENLVQSSKHGVITVSFGSNVKYLPDRLIIKMVNAFGRRKELFLMRFDMHFFTVFKRQNMTIEFEIFARLEYWECNSKRQRSFSYTTIDISKVGPGLTF